MSRTTGRRGSVLFALTLACVAPGAAHAATESIEMSYGFNPPEYSWDGGGTMPSPDRLDAGWYWGDASRSYYPDNYADGFVTPTPGICGTDTHPDPSSSASPPPNVTVPLNYCDNVEQLRGGTRIERYDAADDPVPTRLQAGDTLRLYGTAGADNSEKPTVFTQTVAAPAPVLASVVGSSTATIARTPGSTSVSATLERRIAQSVTRSTFVPGTYHWEASSVNFDDSLCSRSVFDYEQQRTVVKTDVAPDKPAAAPPAGQAYHLRRDTWCTTRTITIPGSPYTTVAWGRIIAISDTSYTVQFAQPLAAGDMLSYRESSTTREGIRTTDLSVSNVAAVGTVPPPPPADTTAPAVKRLDLASLNPTIKDFKKRGFLTFVTMSEPGTVTQVLQMNVAAPKKKKKKSGKKSAKGKTVTVVLGSGTATTTAPGETARVLVTSTKEGRKALGKLKKGKPAKATLVTTLKDAAGNTVTSQAAVKLSGK